MYLEGGREQKNNHVDRCRPPVDGAGNRRQPDQRTEVNPEEHGEVRPATQAVSDPSQPQYRWATAAADEVTPCAPNRKRISTTSCCDHDRQFRSAASNTGLKSAMIRC
jgi:hypothetical protein